MSDFEAYLFNLIDRYMSTRVTEKYATVTSYDEFNHVAKVMIQPDEFETGWLRISEQHIGNGWGIVSGLQIGDQVKVSVSQGDINNGTITGRVHSDQDKPPVAASGEIVIQHESGTKITMSADGGAAINSAAALTITATGAVSLNAASVSING
jgi:uncharacterized protein involved in type VI secretion and phage assembly